MPHINGYELALMLREGFGAKLCLVALTAYGSPGDREMSRSVGFDAHLLKPADVETINAALRRCSAEASPLTVLRVAISD